MSLDETTSTLIGNMDEIADFKRWLGERHENDTIAIDTETSGLDPRDPGARIRLIQFGDTQHGWAMSWEDWRGAAMEAMTQYEGTFAFHNCFSGDTEFITREGMRTLEDSVGETVEVWDGTEWSKADIRSFGDQPLQRVVLAPRGRRSSHHEIVYVTPDHRWELIDGSLTTDLSHGDVIPMRALQA